MGHQLVEYYKKTNELGGLKAKMRLAILTLTPSTKAATEPDSPELLDRFRSAMQELKKEFN